MEASGGWLLPWAETSTGAPATSLMTIICVTHCQHRIHFNELTGNFSHSVLRTDCSGLQGNTNFDSSDLLYIKKLGIIIFYIHSLTQQSLLDPINLNSFQSCLNVSKLGHEVACLLGLLHVELPQVGGHGVLADHGELPPVHGGHLTGVRGE